jgi:hypothetical protein
MSQMEVAKWISAKEHNRQNLYKIYDKIGDEKVVIVGTKELKPTRNPFDDLVYYPYRDRAVSLRYGAEGSGKTVGMEFEAWQLNLAQHSPIFVWDVKKQFLPLRKPLSDKNALHRLTSLGFRPQPMIVLSFAPAFMNSPFADLKWSIKLKDFLNMSPHTGYSNFIHFLAKDELSSANERAAVDIWSDLKEQTRSRILDDMEFLFKSYNHHFETTMESDKKLGGTVGKSIFVNFIQMKELGLFDGVALNFYELINQNEDIDIFAFICNFAPINDSYSFYQRCYSMFLNSMLHDGRERNPPIIPRITKVRDEVDEVIKTSEGEVIAREIKKDRVEQNNLLYAVQYLADTNKEMVGSSDAIMTTRPRSERDLEILSVKNPDNERLKRMFNLKIDTTPFQFDLVTQDSIQSYYPCASPAQFHTSQSYSKV